MRQLFDPTLAQYSYIIGCQRTGEAIVIDPQRDIDRYHQVAGENDLKITAVADTHIHADYLTGAREFAEDPEVTLFLSAEGGDDWQYRWAEKLPNTHLVRDGDSFRVGKIEFQVTSTPGHTPEHVTFTVIDHGGGASTPIGIASGDFVFVGDVGRPDLLESAAGHAGAMEPAARQLYQSLQAFQASPDEVQIWPAHGAGSACGKALGAVPVSTAGYEKRYNPAIAAAGPGSEDAFVDFILTDQPEPPVYWARMKQQNRDGFAPLGDLPVPGRLAASDLGALLEAGEAVVIDTRSDRAAFMQKHVEGSIFAPSGNSFPTIAGSYIEPGRPIYLLVEDTAELDDLVRLLVRIGLDDVRGYLDAGEVFALAEPELFGSILMRRTSEIGDFLEPGETQVLDVRKASEYAQGHLDGALNIAHTRLAARLGEIPDGKRLLVHCASGGRASSASSFLKSQGREVIFFNGNFADAVG
ncbi:MAG: rhodanese-like domain-containing protein [Verrucomicrobiales bacterium]